MTAMDGGADRPARLPGVRIPDAVLALAHARREARLEERWADADRLREEIEAAGWKIEDAGPHFRLVPAHAPTLDLGSETIYGCADDVPSRLGEPASGPATIVVCVTDPHSDAGPNVARLVGQIRATAPPGTSVVIVLDAPADAVAGRIATLAEAPAGQSTVEVVRTSAPLGPGAAWNIGIRRADGQTVIFLDADVEVEGDIVTPLVDALADPTVAVVGAWGLVTSDMRRYEPGGPGRVAAVMGHCLAFRRDDAVGTLPVDEAFQSVQHLDAWWSLRLRSPVADALECPSREAVALAALPLRRREPATAGNDPAEHRARKRSYYRLLDAFGHREDLAVPGRR